MKPERDIYFYKAIEEGYLARSAYKLLQIDEVFNIFDGVTKAVDLCSAPGSWTQVIYNKLHNLLNNYDDLSKLNPNVKIVSVDMMPMNHFPGVMHLQADISQYSTMKLILDEFHDEKVDVVVCDGSIDVVGMEMVDYFMHHCIFLSAFYITLNILKAGGNFVMKVFIKEGQEKIIQKLKLFFENVCVVKPHCSRNKEAFAVCQGYMPLPNFNPLELTPYVEYKDEDFSKLTGVNKVIVQYLCGNDNITANMFKIKALPITNTCEAEEELWIFLDSILKDFQDDIAILRERISKTLLVFDITKDNQLQCNPEALKLLFKGLRCHKNNEEKNENNHEELCNSQEESEKDNDKCENPSLKDGEMEHVTKGDVENDAEICQKIEQCKIEDKMDDDKAVQDRQNYEEINENDAHSCQKNKIQDQGDGGVEYINEERQNDVETSGNNAEICQKLDTHLDSEIKHIGKAVQNEERQSHEESSENDNKINYKTALCELREELLENEVKQMLSNKTPYQDLNIKNCYFNTEIDGKKVSDILKEKVNDVKLEKQGKDLNFKLDWNLFCKGTDIEDVEIFNCGEVTDIYKEFEDIEEELRKRPELSNAYFAKDIISKQEETKKKIRNCFLNTDNS